MERYLIQPLLPNISSPRVTTLDKAEAQPCIPLMRYADNPSLQHVQGGQTPVYLASCNGHSEVVKLLVQAGADLNLPRKVFT